MALRLSAAHIIDPDEGSDPEYRHDNPGESSSEDEDEDLTWDDWVSDSLSKRPCKSLFENKTFDTVQEALAYDESTYGFSLKEITTRLGSTCHYFQSRCFQMSSKTTCNILIEKCFEDVISFKVR